MQPNRHVHQTLQHPPDSSWAKFCPRCGCILEVVAGAVPRQEDRVWLVRRSIEPSSGRWTFPGGYVDLGETLAEAAIRETQEETLLHIRLDGLLNVYSYANVGIVLVVYRATVVGGVAGTTPESQEVRAFRIEDIPWADLAFPSTREALTDYVSADKKSK
jgi:ADP-ribose pyrophosphatase YjhB (NUDIX family)